MSQYPGSPSHTNTPSQYGSNMPNNTPSQYGSSMPNNTPSQYGSNMPNNTPLSPHHMRYNTNGNGMYNHPNPGTPLSHHHRNGFTANGNMNTNGMMPSGGNIGMNGINQHSAMGGGHGTSMNMSAGANPQQNSPSQTNNHLHGNNGENITDNTGNISPNAPLANNVIVNHNMLPPQNENMNRNDATNGASLTTANTKNSNKQNTNAQTNVSNTVLNTITTTELDDEKQQSGKSRIKWDNDDRFEPKYLDSKLKEAYTMHDGASWKHISDTFKELVKQEKNTFIDISPDLCRQRHTRINSRPVDLTDKEVVRKLVTLENNHARFPWKEWAEENLKPNPNKVPVDNRPIDGDRVKNAYHQLKGALDHYKKDRKMPGRTTLPEEAQEVVIEVARKQFGIPDVPKSKISTKGSNSVNPGGLAINPSTPKKSPKSQKKRGPKKANEEDKNMGSNPGNKTPSNNNPPLTITNPMTPSHYRGNNIQPFANNLGTPNVQQPFSSPNPQFPMTTLGPGPNASPIHYGPYNNYPNQYPNYGGGTYPMTPNPMTPNPMISPNPSYPLMSPMNGATGGVMMNNPIMRTPNRPKSNGPKQGPPNIQIPISSPHYPSHPQSSYPPQGPPGNFPPSNTPNINPPPQNPYLNRPMNQYQFQSQIGLGPNQMGSGPNQMAPGSYPSFNSKVQYNVHIPMNNTMTSPLSNKQAKEAPVQTPSNKRIKLSPTLTPKTSHSLVGQETKYTSPNPPPPIDTKGGNSTPFQMSPYTPYTPISSINSSHQPPTTNSSSGGQHFISDSDITLSIGNQKNITMPEGFIQPHQFSTGVSSPVPFGNTNNDKSGIEQSSLQAEGTINMNHSVHVPKINSGNENLGAFNDTDTVITEPNSTTLTPVHNHKDTRKSDSPVSSLGKRKAEDKPSREELEKENSIEGQFSVYNTTNGNTSTTTQNLPHQMKLED